ncbi:MAG: phosphoribosylformylglycinamidine synthase [Gammaproteobacteria bacterium]|nr:phosphoribosylformylglycinamidine synthase [Gammaproteobacteria bacterium]
MLVYRGKSPHSTFRKKKLLQTLQKYSSTLIDIDARNLYFIESEPLSREELTQLIKIVDDTSIPWSSEGLANVVYVTPRFGTLSPWSSKATDILHVCGITKVRRIEKGVAYQFEYSAMPADPVSPLILPLLHDRMTEVVNFDFTALENLFLHHDSMPSTSISLAGNGIEKLKTANDALGLALSDQEINYLNQSYGELQRDPSIAELMMFAQINSEHCRHKIFNASWTLEEARSERSLFAMIRNTYQVTRKGVLSAYSDNAAVIEGHTIDHFFVHPIHKQYEYLREPLHAVIKVETHNHPTAIAPFAGAATGAGGEIRDEGATGIGAKPKAGLVGFSVSNLHLPGLPQPWEQISCYPEHIATSLDIMLQAPIGAAAFNNEFGRPNICGYFRTYEMQQSSSEGDNYVWGYHKPIMIAGGVGNIRPMSIKKKVLEAGAKLIVLGGPAMLIGLGGGAASSIFSGSSHEELDFASVQRSNPEMQRRCQEVINACFALGEENPIISIHDVGAGGLSNALTELVHDSNKGALIELRAITIADASMNAMEIWCNESQERYVLGIDPRDLNLFQRIALRERCPFAVVGDVNEAKIIELRDSKFNESPVNLPLNILFGEASKLHKTIDTATDFAPQPLNINLPIKELVHRVLQLPSVADKSFLITIGDRSVTGLVSRDQMVGPWQVPVADVGVTATGYNDYVGEALSMGERSPVALINARASARLAVGEAITNIIAADVKNLSDIKLSANWMAAANYEDEARKLYEAVHEVGMELCPALGICIPVGKDSLSMQMKWSDETREYNVAAPLSLVISAFSPVEDIRRTLTPQLVNVDSELCLIDLGCGKNRLGASALAQVVGQIGGEAPTIDDTHIIIHFFNTIKELREKNLLLAYHDRSDGGLLATLAEMMFASHLGISVELDNIGDDFIANLFNEELGAVIQYEIKNKNAVIAILEKNNLADCFHQLGSLNDDDKLNIYYNNQMMFSESRIQLHRLWSATSYQLRSLRDNPVCAEQEFDRLLDASDPGLNASLTFNIPSLAIIKGVKPKVAIIREQGVNGHVEMAAAFDRAGFAAMDIHMTDILSGAIELHKFQGIVACGGFSYGDVLGAGKGWANSILFNERAREQFYKFFNLPNVFGLGVCNGCQMMSHLKELIPGAESWPTFAQNISEQFEARLSMVRINPSPSILFQGMENSVLPIVVSHGEGKVEFENPQDMHQLVNANLIPLQYVDNKGQVTEAYPSNPNGSAMGITALTNADGRFTIMMPHAERIFRNVQFSWRPSEWQTENSPWLQLFVNARNWLQ